MDNELIDSTTLSRLRWRCRRGLLENDLFIERFFRQFAPTLTQRQSRGLTALMDLADNDLLDLHLGRRTLAEVAPGLDRDEVREVLLMLRTAERSNHETC